MVSLGVPNLDAAPGSLPRVLVFEEAVRGNEDTQLRWPVAAAAASEEEFAVVDAKPARFLVFRKLGVSWQLAQTIPLPAAPAGLAHVGNRYVVALRGTEGLMALEGEQMLIRKVGLPEGVIPGVVAARGDGGLLVYDYATGRVFKFDPNGNLLAQTAIEGRATGLAEGPGGEMWVAVGEQSAVLRYDPNGAMTARVEIPGQGPVPSWPTGIVVDADGDVAVIDRHVGRILLFDDRGSPFGTGSRKGAEPGLLHFPRSVGVLGEDRLLVADEGNGRVQIFRRTDKAETP
jgi:DNA-binding beta-propeller fold protein YncE